MMTREERVAKIEEFNKKHNATTTPSEFPRLILIYTDAKTETRKAFIPEVNKRYDTTTCFGTKLTKAGVTVFEIKDPSFEKEDRDYYAMAGNVVRLPYFKYDKDLGVLKIGQLSDPGRRSKDEIRPIDFNEDYVESIYAFKGEKMFYKSNGYTIKEQRVKYRTCYEYAMLGKYMSFIIGWNQTKFKEEYHNEIVEFAGGNTWIGPGYTEYEFNNLWDFQRYMEYTKVPKKPKNTDEEKEVIKKIEKELDNTDEYKKYLPEEDPHSYHTPKVGIYKKIDGIDTIAVYVPNVTTSYVDGRYKRYIGDKLYLKSVCIIGKKTVSTYSLQNHGEFIKKVTTGYGADMSNTKIANINQLYANVERIKYLKDILKDSNNQVGVIVGITRHPEVELICKAGATSIAERIMRDMTCIPSTEKEIFGDDFKYLKTRKLSENIGLSNKQLVIYDKIFKENSEKESMRWRRRMRVIQNMKKDFPNIEHWDNEKFEKRCRMYYDMSDVQYAATYRWDRRSDSFTIKTAMQERFSISDDEYEKLISRFETFKNDVDWGKTIADVMNQMDGVVDEDHKEIFSHKLLTAKTERDIINLHDEVTTYRIEKRNESKRIEMDNLNKKMKKTDEKRKDLQYEEEDYIIKLPDHIADLEKEGAILSHCVGGYSGDHANGYTTILFLRKKESPNVPFYTIEVRDEAVVQIHGRNNRWLGCNPEAIPTVMRWLRKTGVSCNELILTSKALGYYGGGADRVELPVID